MVGGRRRKYTCTCVGHQVQYAYYVAVFVDSLTRFACALQVVKQTVMTNVYGVTFIGARDQISGQLRDRGDVDDSIVFEYVIRHSGEAWECEVIGGSGHRLNVIGSIQITTRWRRRFVSIRLVYKGNANIAERGVEVSMQML